MTCEGAVPSVSSQPGTWVPPAPKPAFPGATNAIHSALPTEDTDYPCISSDIQQVKLSKVDGIQKAVSQSLILSSGPNYLSIY